VAYVYVDDVLSFFISYELNFVQNFELLKLEKCLFSVVMSAVSVTKIPAYSSIFSFYLNISSVLSLIAFFTT
jgi:hypothetical protein